MGGAPNSLDQVWLVRGVRPAQEFSHHIRHPGKL